MSVTVITPATAKRLTTAAHARADLGLPAGAPSDEQLERFIDQASARAASFCRRQFGRETVRERFEVCRGTIDDTYGGLLLDRSPVVSVASVKVDGTALITGEYESDGSSIYRLQDGERRCWHGRVILVEYEAGWLLPGEERGEPPTTTAPDLPLDVERAVIQLLGATVSASGRDMMVKSESNDGVGDVSYYVQGASAALPHPEAEAALSDYRRLIFA